MKHLNKNKSKGKVIRRVSILGLILTIAIVITVVLCNVKTTKTYDPSFIQYNSYYNGSQVEMDGKTSHESTSSTVTMTNAYSNLDTDYAEKTITISSADELYKFSQACNSKEKFLTYSYKLLCNIDYDETGIADFIPIGLTTPFSGTFDGDGWDISNLELVVITSNNQESYSNISYYAMFAQNNGTIKNFGLVDPTVIISTTITTLSTNGSISNVCGLNSGTISGVYVRQLSTSLVDECGITASGEYRVSGFVGKNTGNISECYLATNSVYNYTLTDNILEFADIALESTGTIEETYFYDSSIQNCTQTEINGTGTTTYCSDLGANEKTGAIYGKYVSAITNLNDVFTSNDAWRVKSTVTSKIESHYTNETPVRRNLAFETSANDKGTITGATATISDSRGFLMMYELMNENAEFASSIMTYKIAADIDLAGLPVSAYTYTHMIGATIEGIEVSGTVTLVNGDTSKNPTIYNANIMDSTRNLATAGLNCYGLFPYLVGTVKNLNVYAKDIDLNKISEDTNNAKAIGALAGYAEGATIDNVNVYMTVTNTSSKLGEYYLGGIVGVLGGEGNVCNSTAAGTFALTADTTYPTNGNSSYMGGVAVGGAIGYVESSLGDIDTVLSGVTINANLGSSTTYAVGGVIGAAYTRVCKKLENVGDVTVGSTSSTTAYSNLYLSGVIGRLMGESGETSDTAEVNNFVNQGTISLYGNTSATKSYVSGLLNADIQLTSQFVNKAGERLFYASSLTNRAAVNVYNTGYSDKLEYTSGVNVISSNGFKSTLSNVYNLNNTFKYNTSSSTTTASNREQNKIDDQSINMNVTYKYAPCINVVGSTSAYNVTLQSVYNLKNITYTASSALTNDLTYTGAVLGKYINYTDVRNEGNLTLTLDKTLGTSSTSNNLKLLGVFEEISSSFSATEIYNGGDINVTYTANVYGNIYTSGICYANRNGYSSVDEFNPSSTSYDSSKIGSLNQAINNGSITVTNPNFTNVTYTNACYANANGSNISARVLQSSFNGANVTGDIYTSGITTINESVITNTFNLGNILSANYIKDSSVEREVISSGISILNIGQFSIIENSANNGDIKSINLSTDVYTITSTKTWTGSAHVFTNIVLTNKPTTEYKAKVIATGISARNDECEDGTSYAGNTNNAKQIVSFTINYGTVYAYDFTENITSALGTPSAIASGILGSGLCSVINTVNYGQIYSSEIVASTFGNIVLSEFSNELSSTTINISNSLNYASVYFLQKGYNKAYADGDANVFDNDLNYPTYSIFITDSITNSDYIATSLQRAEFQSYAGSIIGLVNYNNDTNVNNVKIRYLISFLDTTPVYGAAANVPSNVDDNVASYIYSAYKTINAGSDVCDVYLNKPTNYAPLTSEAYTSTFLVNGSGVNKTYYGVFSDNFPFKKAINNEYLNGSEYYNTNTYPTDKFLTDYFEFVSYKYVNSVLMDKIGWKTMAYLDAATKFATSLEGNSKFLEKYSTINSTQYATDLESAFSTNTWSQYANSEILKQYIEELIDENNANQTKEIIEYLFSDSNANSVVINSSFRSTIVTYMLEKYPTLLANSDLFNFSNYYSSVLADVLDTTEDNEVKQYIQNNLSSYITELSSTTKEELLLSYIKYLEDYGDKFFSDTTEVSKYNLLDNFFSTLDATTDASFYNTLYSLFSDRNKTIIDNYNSSMNAYGGYQKLTNDQKISLLQAIINNNDETKLSNYLDKFANEIGMFDYLKDAGYDASSFSNIETNIQSSSTSTTSDEVIDERIKVWNQIKDTETFKTYFNSLYGTNVKYYKATEANNTYQSDTAPAVLMQPENSSYYKNSYGIDNTLGMNSDLNYLYTSDENISPSTYFYGPYANSSGQLITGVGSNTGYNGTSGPSVSAVTVNSSNLTGKKWYSIYISGTSGAYTTAYSKYVASKGSKTAGLNKAERLYFLKSDGHQLDTELAETPVEADTRLKKTTDYMIYNGTKIELNQAVLKYVNSNSFTISGNTISSSRSYSIYSQNGTKLTDTSGFTYMRNNYAVSEYISSSTTSWHSTGYTGIYAFGDNTWTSNGTRYAFKLDGSNGDGAILTTSYIDYNASQILLLDGVLSNYGDKTTKDSTERSIINDIFNNYLLTSTNKDNFIKIVKKALLESINVKITDTSKKATFVDSIVTSGINTTTTIDSSKPLVYLAYSDSQTVNKYLSSQLTDSTTNKRKIISAAAGNRSVFVELFQLLYDVTKTYGINTTDAASKANFGGSLDVESLYNRMGYIYNTTTTIYSTDLYYTRNSTGSWGNYTYTYELVNSQNLSSGTKYYQIKNMSSTQVTPTSNDLGSYFTKVNDQYVLVTDSSFSSGTQYYQISNKETSSSSNYWTSITPGAITNPYYTKANARSDWGSTVSYDSTGSSGSYPVRGTSTSVTFGSNSVKTYNGYALPFVVYNDLNQSTYQSLLDSSTTTKSNYETIASNNIGYLTGSNNSVKVLKKTVSASVSGLQGTSGSYTDFNIYTKTSSTSNDNISVETGTSSNGTIRIPSTIKNNILQKINSGNLYTIRFTGQASNNNLIALNDGITVAGQTYTSTSYLPQDTIWFTPQYNGVIKIALTSASDGTDGFTLYKITRDTSTRKDSNNPYSAYISSVDAILNVYTNSYGDISYTALDGYTLAYSSEYCRNLTAGNIYYYEIPVEAGVEYALGNANSSGSYLLYLDLGQNGTTQTKLNTYTVQNTVSSFDDSKINSVISYLTSLEGKTAYVKVSDTDTYDSSKEYYEYSNGKYITPSAEVTSSNYKNYYTRETGNLTIENYQDLLFNDDFKKLLLKTSNKALLTYIKTLSNVNDLNDVLLKFVETSSLMFDSIITNQTTTINNSDELKRLLIAAYYATNYNTIYNNSQTNSSVNVSQTILYERLQDLDSKYQYINSDGSIDNDKFEDFCDYIGYSLNNIAFGIYALSSSTGIKNGTFIPDNVLLIDMDAPYIFSANDIISLTDSNSSSWRDYTGASTSSNYDTSNQSSVNYAIRIEMKQLKQAISTTIFELDLDDSGDSLDKLFATEDTISEANATITYYVPSSYIDTLKTKTAFTISNKVIASTASSFKTNNNNQTTVNLTGGVMNGENFEVANAITVIAQDTTVITNYKMVFIPVTVDFEFTSDTTSLEYTGGKVTLTITTTNMPDGFDFTPYFSIVNNATSYKETDEVSHFSFDQTVINNGVVSNNSATLVIVVDETLPGGTETFTLNAYGVSKTIDISKTLNTEANLKANFEGNDLKFSSGNETVTSSIKFGRAYDYQELTDPNNSNFYLNTYSVSANATVSITAIKEDIEGTGRIRYIVTYNITSESGTTTTYTHILEEMNYFDSTYADIYKDGTALNNDGLYKTDFTYNNSTLSKDKSSLTYSDGVFAAVTFRRSDTTPEYRIKYNLNNFYTLGNNTFEYTADGSYTKTYHGITVTVSGEPGVYKYVYTYVNTGKWLNDEEYTRSYDLPALYVVKGYSTDALLSRLTFLDSSIVLGNTVSVMKSNTATSTAIISASNAKTVDGKEATYNDLFTGTTNTGIEIKGKTIRYSDNAKSSDITDYYAIGTVSDSDLSYYAPTFAIEDHAQIYQYTTKEKLQSYGSSQTVSDATILTNHDTMYLYVPFTYQENGETLTKIFLVEVTTTGTWNRVYETTYNGKDESDLVYTYPSTDGNTQFTTLEATTTPSLATFTSNGVQYTLSSDAGTVSNASLYMDYVGDPLDGHFWYVSYVVFSESYLHGETEAGNIRYFHISIVDATNVVYFDVTLWATEVFSQTEIYMTISENIYSDKTMTSTRQISGYLTKQDTSNSSNVKTVGDITYYKYLLRIKLQTLPKGYFYFYIDLPDGYTVIAMTDKVNTIDQKEEPGSKEEGAYLPYTSIITNTVKLIFVVNEGENTDSSKWAVSTSDIYTRKATYNGDKSDTSNKNWF